MADDITTGELMMTTQGRTTMVILLANLLLAATAAQAEDVSESNGNYILD